MRPKRSSARRWAGTLSSTSVCPAVPSSTHSWFWCSSNGAAGTLLLAPSLISRIPRKWLRRTVGWTLALAAAAAAPFLGLTFFFAVLLAAGSGDYVKVVAPDGQSVLVTQDDFDGDVVHIYTHHDDFIYKFDRPAPELSGWPRVEDHGCRLDTVGEELQLICGAHVLSVNPEEYK